MFSENVGEISVAMHRGISEGTPEGISVWTPVGISRGIPAWIAEWNKARISGGVPAEFYMNPWRNPLTEPS